MPPTPCALVLSGGAALGAAHLGVIEELERRQLQPDFICGVSAGALVGGLLACGKSAAEICAIIYGTKFLRLALDFRGSAFGLINGNKIGALIERLFEGRQFSDLPIPFHAGAADFESGERVTISSGSVAAAVRASISVPIIFAPYFHSGENRWLVDGGLVQNLPIDIAVNHYQGERIIACDVCSFLEPKPNFKPQGVLKGIGSLRSSVERTMRIVFKTQQRDLPRDPRVSLITPNLAGFSALDLKKMPQIQERGRLAAVEALGGS